MEKVMLLIGDVGGTKTALAVVDPGGNIRQHLVRKQVLSADYPSMEALLSQFIGSINYPIEYLAIGVPGPVVDGCATGTNIPWVVDQAKLKAYLGLHAVCLLNDLESIANAIPHLSPDGITTLNAVPGQPGGAIAVVAPGTGLGEAYLTWDGTRYRAHPAEGGHANFGPDSPLEFELASYLWQRYQHVSNERVCSGLGLPNIYRFLKAKGLYVEPDWLAATLLGTDDPTPVIVQEALRGDAACPLCRATLELFVGILGAEAGNLALRVLATGGVYLGGGIPPRIVNELQKGAFLKAFCHKGRIAYVMETIPVHVIMDPHVALLGVALRGVEMLQPG
jgi:glucokinase